ncbi:anaphase-promoting complex subunit Hcn1 [Quaeritorhiza haematococci]|nr:anaphase-promoting complex subunit Hcn1 [Quaeritorhiza haematococci]
MDNANGGAVTLTFAEYQRLQQRDLIFQRDLLAECIQIKSRLDHVVKRLEDSVGGPDAVSAGGGGGLTSPGGSTDSFRFGTVKRMHRASYSGRMDMLKHLFETSLNNSAVPDLQEGVPDAISGGGVNASVTEGEQEQGMEPSLSMSPPSTVWPRVTEEEDPKMDTNASGSSQDSGSQNNTSGDLFRLPRRRSSSNRAPYKQTTLVRNAALDTSDGVGKDTSVTTPDSSHRAIIRDVEAIMAGEQPGAHGESSTDGNSVEGTPDVESRRGSLDANQPGRDRIRRSSFSGKIEMLKHMFQASLQSGGKPAQNEASEGMNDGKHLNADASGVKIHVNKLDEDEEGGLPNAENTPDNHYPSADYIQKPIHLTLTSPSQRHLAIEETPSSVVQKSAENMSHSQEAIQKMDGDASHRSELPSEHNSFLRAKRPSQASFTEPLKHLFEIKLENSDPVNFIHHIDIPPATNTPSNTTTTNNNNTAAETDVHVAPEGNVTATTEAEHSGEPQHHTHPRAMPSAPKEGLKAMEDVVSGRRRSISPPNSLPRSANVSSSSADQPGKNRTTSAPIHPSTYVNSAPSPPTSVPQVNNDSHPAVMIMSSPVTNGGNKRISNLIAATAASVSRRGSMRVSQQGPFMGTDPYSMSMAGQSYQRFVAMGPVQTGGSMKVLPTWSENVSQMSKANLGGSEGRLQGGKQESLGKRKSSARSRSESFRSFTIAVSTPQYDELGHIDTLNRKKNHGSTSMLNGIHPFSMVNVRWELFMLGMVVSAIYAIDIVIQLFTLRIPPNHNKYGTLKESQLAYISSCRFFIDLAGTIPWENIAIAINPNMRNAELLVLVRMLRFGKLVEIMTLNPIFTKALASVRGKLKVPEQFANLITFLALFLVIIHWYACMIFMMGKISDYSGEEWVVTSILAKNYVEQYTYAYLNSLQNVFQVGYAPDFLPERIMTILYVFIAGLVYAGVVGMISSISFGLNASSRMFRQKMDEIMEYLEFKRVDDETKLHVRNYMNYKYRGKYFDEQSILKEFNQHTRDRILLGTGAELVRQVPFFNRSMGDGRDRIWVQRVVNNLKAEYYLSGDYIFEQGDEADEMFFIFRGWVEIIVDETVVRKLEEGSFFGEVAPLGNTTRTASVRAGTNCILYALTKKDLDRILNEFPDMMERFASVAMQRLRIATEEQREKISGRGKIK